MEQVANYIGGGWQGSAAVDTSDVINPATAEVLAKTPLGGQADVDRAAEAAATAFPDWRRTPAGERIQYLFKFKQLD